MSKTWLIWSLCFFVLLILSGCSVSNSQSTPLEKELQEDFLVYLNVWNDAQITYDTSKLSYISTGNQLKNMVNFIEAYQKLETKGETPPVRSAEEFEIERFEILASGESWAVVEVKKNYLTYSQNVQTGEKLYDSIRRWRVQRFLLIKEEGRWKVDRILEGVSWSG